MPRRDKLFDAVNEILFLQWDPIGVRDNDLARDEYKSYARTVCRYLREGADQHKIANYLGQVSRVAIGLSQVDEERDTRIAKRLLDLCDG